MTDCAKYVSHLIILPRRVSRRCQSEHRRNQFANGRQLEASDDTRTGLARQMHVDPFGIKHARPHFINKATETEHEAPTG
jgi:hypothetical protein